MATFWAFCHATLNEGGASGTRKGSAVAYVEGETTFGALNYLLSVRHDTSPRWILLKRDSMTALLKIYGKHSSLSLGFVLSCEHSCTELFTESVHKAKTWCKNVKASQSFKRPQNID